MSIVKDLSQPFDFPFFSFHVSLTIRLSMTEDYDCYQNALAKRVNEILKTEVLLPRPKDAAEATRMVNQSVHIYNSERRHLSLKYKTPDARHRAF
jgi:putative transposase